MNIGIISDTHDQISLVKKAVNIFQSNDVDLIYHCGDWCSPFVMQFFSGDIPLKSVFGNNDADIYKLISFRPDNITFHDRFFVDEVAGKKIAVIHGDPAELAEAVFASGRYDVVLRGHNHKAEIRTHHKTLMINPGNLLGPIAGHEDWTSPSVAIYDTDSHEARILNL